MAGARIGARGGLEELRLIRELRPPANTRQYRTERYVYLRRRGDDVVVSSHVSELGPIRSRRAAELAARALRGWPDGDLAAALPRLRQRMEGLSEALRYEDAARLRDRIAALERVVAHLRRLERLRRSELCLLAPAVEDGWWEAFFLSGGRIAARRKLPPGPGARLELEAGAALARAAEISYAPEHADELLVVAPFLRRPPPELRVLPLAGRLVA